MTQRTLIAVLGCALLAAGCQPQPAAESPVDLEVRETRASYAVGLDMARNFKEQGLPIEAEALVAGLRDGLVGEPRLEGDELMAGIAEFRTLVNESLAANAGPEAAANLEAGRAFLATNSERAEVVVTDSGLQYEVVQPGDGPMPGPSDTVVVHYRGTGLDGEVFDESYGGAPARFLVTQVIPGWAEGLQLMQVGSTFNFWVPAELGYGVNPPPGASFGPNALLAFQVELLEIVSP